jgi:virulence-associated protein VagC
LLAAINALEKEIRMLEQQAVMTPASRATLDWVEVRRVSKIDAMMTRRQRSGQRRQREGGNG